jgi:hypothetical protein
MIVFYACNFANDYISILWKSFCTTFCGQTKRAFRVRACSATVAVVSGHGVVVTPCATSDVKCGWALCVGKAVVGRLHDIVTLRACCYETEVVV